MLGSVEVRQWVEGIPIAISVLVRSPISWSEDNNIAVVTQLGTYIFELSLSSEECSPGIVYTRSFIPPPKEPNQWLNTGVPIKSLLEKLDNKVSHSIMLDGILSAGQRTLSEQTPLGNRTISPAIPGGIANHLGYYRGTWSPFGIGVQSRCLLALVTHDHQMMIVGQEGRQWTKLLDITEKWYKYVSSNSWALVKQPPNTPAHQVYIARMSMLSILEILWTPVFKDDDGKYSILLMITASGNAVFWRVPVNFSGKEGIHIIDVKGTHMKHISSVYWKTVSDGCGYLMVGNSSGQVKIFYCKSSSTEVQLEDLGFIFEDEDRVQVNNLQLIHIKDEQYLLLLGKHNIFTAFTIDLMADRLQAHKMACCHVGKLAISGIKYLENNNIYVTVKDGIVQHMSVHLGEERNVSIELLGNSFRSEGVSFTGLATSPNASLWGILESVSVAYDHLVVREPTQLNIYQVSKPATIMNYLLESSAPLHCHADLLESLRLATCKNGEPLKLPIHEEIVKCPLNELQVYYWVTKMSRSTRISDIKPIELLEDLELQLQTTILEGWIRDCLLNMVKTDIPFVPDIALSLSLMCEWLTKTNNEGDLQLSESVKRKIGLVTKETCLVCREEVPLDSLINGKCSKGHGLPRCCRTLLLTRPTIQCIRCRIFTHPAASILLGGRPTCTYCDGFMADEVGGRRRPTE